MHHVVPVSPSKGTVRKDCPQEKEGGIGRQSAVACAFTVLARTGLRSTFPDALLGI